MSQKNTYNWKGKTILVAEDDSYSFRYLEVLLTRNGASVIHANNGVDAFIECIKNLNIQLILMDIKMPRLNGFDTARLIHKYRPDLPIIAETAYAGSYDIDYIRKSVFSDFLIKPIERNDLYESINQNLQSVEENYNSGTLIYN